MPTAPTQEDLTQFRMFLLRRTVDTSGVSGVGIVAEGVQFSCGTVCLRWIVGDHRSMVIWDCIQDVLAIHGHNGNTTVEWR